MGRVCCGLLLLLTIFCSLALADYGKKLCQQSGFYCYVAARGDTWKKVFGDKSDLIKKLNRINLRMRTGMMVAVPVDIQELTNEDFLEFSPFPQQIDPPGEKIIYVNLSKLAWAAYDPDGMQQYWGPVSGGQGYCPDLGRGCHTPTGTFYIYQTEGRGCYSTKFPVGRGGAPMPYCMFFYGGFALHGSYEVPGHNASHGCVRMFIDDAEWLNEEFIGDDRHIPVVIN